MIFTSPPFLSAAVMASKVASTADAAAVLVMLALPATAAISSFLVIARVLSSLCPESAGICEATVCRKPANCKPNRPREDRRASTEQFGSGAFSAKIMPGWSRSCRGVETVHSQSIADCLDEEPVRPIDDFFDRRRLGEHRRRPRENLISAGQMRQTHVGKYLDGGLPGVSQPVLERRQIRLFHGRSDRERDPLGIEGCRKLRGRALDDPRSEPVLVAQNRRRRRLQVPNDPEPGQRIENVKGRVDLPRPEPLADAALISVVIVVPPLAHREDGEQPVVPGIVGREVALASPYVGERVYAKR